MNRSTRRLTPSRHQTQSMQAASLSTALEHFTIKPARADYPSAAACKLTANHTGNQVRLGTLDELKRFCERMGLPYSVDRAF